jgi:uncharacterized membrane protein AbrB (regulator of aidB expression)
MLSIHGSLARSCCQRPLRPPGAPSSRCWLAGGLADGRDACDRRPSVGLPPRLRDGAFVLLGISVGSSVTPESVEAMGAWPGSILLLAISIVATILISSY